ncbi:hypothetical protein E2K80_02000 [Rhodophyticola sp. CCM32]|nr:hypothetical protein E2K80_02000 [Rhodophyticola sp. CCM32]
MAKTTWGIVGTMDEPPELVVANAAHHLWAGAPTGYSEIVLFCTTAHQNSRSIAFRLTVETPFAAFRLRLKRESRCLCIHVKSKRNGSASC